jgi:hypothetical protein
MFSYGHILFSNGIGWQDPSVLVNWACTIFEQARIILCAATRIQKQTKQVRGVQTSTFMPTRPTLRFACSLPLAFLSLKSLHLSKTEKLFQIEGQLTAASQRYCGQLTELFKSNAANLKAYIRAEQANSHGIGKGSATAVTSGTTLPPPTSSIAAHGNWSLRQILDIYWHFAEPGDHYLGRCLAGLDPNSADFAVLPPHFTVGDPMEHPRIREAIDLMYGPALSKWVDTRDSDPAAIFCKLLPLVVYH